MPTVLLLLIGCGSGGFAVGVPLLRADVERIDLGNVPLGIPATFDVEVFNDGLGDASASITYEAPADGPARVTVPAGSSAMVRAEVVLESVTPVDIPIRFSAGDSGFTLVIAAAGLLDADGDGYIGTLAGGDDCDDGDASVHPGAPDACNGFDDDCNGTADDPVEPVLWYADADQDGFGDAASPMAGGCTRPAGHSANPDDCDDSDASVSPAATEIWYDGTDQDCDGADDDRDGDGFPVAADCDDLEPTAFPGALELDDGVDQDCDGLVDEDFVQRGNAVFSEVHTQPSVAAGAYVEVYNLGPGGLQLDLLTLSGVPIVALAPLEPGVAGLICASGDRTQNGALDCYGVAPIPDSGAIELHRGTALLDELDLAVAAPGLETAADIDTRFLDPDDNDEPAAWCASQSTAPSGDAGSPNALPGALCP
ncbi:MAG: putative metal-binding motif-containing protein [Alphaproteobacteria bacterium]|nr:putative metal-binding motif-containing protein [Alphaproteobacteria bacterium]